MYGEIKGGAGVIGPDKQNRVKLDPLVDDPIKIVKWAP